MNKIDELSKELYKLSREKSFITKELDFFNKKEIDNEILLSIHKIKKINFGDENQFYGGIEFIDKKFNNGLNIKLALFDFNDKKIAINVDSRYVIKNQEYFEHHHSLVKYDEIKQTNKEIKELRNNPYAFNIKIQGDEISYSQKEVKVSKKHNLLNSSEFAELFKKINAIHDSDDSNFQKYFEFKDLLIKTEEKIKKVKDVLIKYNFTNPFVETLTVDKTKEVEIDFNDEISSQIERKVNGHLTVENLLSQGKYVLPEAFEEKTSIKLFMIGTKDEIEKKLKNLIKDVNKKEKEKEENFQQLLVEDIDKEELLSIFDDIN